MLSFDCVGEIRVTDENEIASKLGIKLNSFRSVMQAHSFQIKRTITDERSKMIYESSLTSNDASSILKLNCKSYLQVPKLSFPEKIHSLLQNEDNIDLATSSNGEHDVVSHL